LRVKAAISDGDSEVQKVEKLVRLRITQGLVPRPNYRLSARKLAKELKVSRDTTWRALRLPVCQLNGREIFRPGGKHRSEQGGEKMDDKRETGLGVHGWMHDRRLFCCRKPDVQKKPWLRNRFLSSSFPWKQE
jgi:hypothetical protein